MPRKSCQKFMSSSRFLLRFLWILPAVLAASSPATSSAPWTSVGEQSRVLPLVYPIFQHLKSTWTSEKRTSASTASTSKKPAWPPKRIIDNPADRASTKTANSLPKSPLESLWYSTRVAIAGGVGGAVGTAVLYPFDSAKTLRQSNPLQHASVRHALWALLQTPATAVSQRQWHLLRAYRGVVTSTLGAIPSSALYFGAYETCKLILRQSSSTTEHSSWTQRWKLHSTAAICGNCCSSAIFVPKELIKQQLQSSPSSSLTSVVHTIFQSKGMAGFYQGYKATLLRNIPSAMLRFALYEELKLWLAQPNEDDTPNRQLDVRLFAAGAMAGAIASGLMTPMDVMKTRIATGTCPVDVKSCVGHVWHEQGLKGIYAGAGSRMLWSGAFSAIGFGTFEWTKSLLGVPSSK